nr:MAG TPA: hypothetical protein [Microviridae sp.]
MRKPIYYAAPTTTNYEFMDGERIESKIARIIENGEPISDGAPIIYTNREEGVIPAYNIRTDKWSIAQNAMDVINKTNLAKGNQPKAKEEAPNQNSSATLDAPENVA